MPSPPDAPRPSPATAAELGVLLRPASRVPALDRLGYGFGNVAFSLPYQAVASLLVFFTTAILKVPAAAAGTAIALTIVWDAAIDPLLGYLSDNTEGGRWGRRHSYLLAGGLLVAALTAILWSIPPDASAAVRFWGVFVVVTALKTALSVYSIPYLALGGELSADYDERAAIQGYRAAFYLVGMIAAIAGATLIFFRSTPEYPRGQLNPEAYPRMGAAFALAALFSAAVCIAATWKHIPRLPRRTEEMRRRRLSVRNLIADFLGALRNRELRMLVLMIFIIEAGFQFGIAIGFHTNTYTYGMSGPMIGLLTLIVLGTSILSQPLWVAFTKRYEKEDRPHGRVDRRLHRLRGRPVGARLVAPVPHRGPIAPRDPRVRSWCSPASATGLSCRSPTPWSPTPPTSRSCGPESATRGSTSGCTASRTAPGCPSAPCSPGSRWS